MRQADDCHQSQRLLNQDDTPETKDLLNTRLDACDYWANKLGYEADARMIIYRTRTRPANINEEVGISTIQ